MKRSNKFIRKFISTRYNIPGYQDQSVIEALLNAQHVLENASDLSVESLVRLLPRQFILKTNVIDWPEGSILLRSRLMGVTDWREAGYWGRSEFWEAPAKSVNSFGRLNEPGESVFYLANDPTQTFKEIRYQHGRNQHESVVLSSFIVKREFQSTVIGAHDKSVSVANIYSNMIHILFSYPSEIYGNNVYKLSNYLSNFYNYVPGSPQVFAYPPVGNSDPAIMNVAFVPEDAHQYLNYSGSVVIPSYQDSIDGKITVAFANDENFNVVDPSSNLKWIKNNFMISF